jgi:hypothetical protein
MIFLAGRFASGADCQWNYVYHGGDPCDPSWDVASNSSGHGIEDDAHGRRALSSSEAPLVYGSRGHGQDEMEETLLRFANWPTIALICFGWLIMSILGFGRVINRRRRSSLIHAVALRFRSEGVEEFQDWVTMDLDHNKVLKQLNLYWERQKQAVEEQLSKLETESQDLGGERLRHHHNRRAFPPRGRLMLPEFKHQNPGYSGQDPEHEDDGALVHTLSAQHREKVASAQVCKCSFTWLSNRTIQKTMAVSQYLMCNYVGI